MFKPLASGSVWPGTNLKDIDVWMSSKRHGFAAKQLAYQSMVYPFSRLVSGMHGHAGWGAAIMKEERLEEDVGRLLAELRLGTTAVEMN